MVLWGAVNDAPARNKTALRHVFGNKSHLEHFTYNLMLLTVQKAWSVIVSQYLLYVEATGENQWTSFEITT